MAVSDDALTTRANVKEFLKIQSCGADDDALIDNLINRFTDMFETYCGVISFKAKNYTDYYDGTGTKYLFLNNIPVNSITEINEDSDWVWAVDTTIAVDVYRIVDKKYVVMNSDYFTSGDQNYKVKYNAGYETIPYDLEHACVLEVSRAFKHRKNFDVITQTNQDGTLQYQQRGLMDQTETILNKYINQQVY
jgi:hypothetical protein